MDAIGFSGALTFADGSNAGGLAIGASIARNKITNDVQAYILDSTANSGGDVRLFSTNNSVVDANSTAVSVALTAANQKAISLSGGGAESTNVILPTTNAYVGGSIVTSGGDVDIRAIDQSTVSADVLAAAITATLGLSKAAGVAIGVSFSTNLIGWEASFGEAIGPTAGSADVSAEVQAYVNNSQIAAAGDLYLTALASGTITAGVDAIAVGITGSAGNAGQGSGAGVRTENRIRTQVRALIDGTVASGDSDQGIITADSANLIAADRSSITTNALSAAVAAAFGADNALGATIGVSLARNEVLNNVEASITGETVTVERAVADQAGYREQVLPQHTVVENGGSRYRFIGTEIEKVDLSAESYTVDTRWEDVTDDTTSFDVTYQSVASDATKAGRIKLEAKEHATIDADATAASVAIAGSGKVSVALSGGGAEAVNVIGTNTNAFLTGSTITSAGDVTLDVRNSSHIGADVVAVAGSVGIGSDGGAAAAIGASVAHNYIGYNENGSKMADGAQVQASISDSAVTATLGELRQTAISDQSIRGEVIGGAVAISGSTRGPAGALAGAGSKAVNRIATEVKAFIDGDSAGGIHASTISLIADDTSQVTTISVGASLAANYAPTTAVAIAVGVSLSKNEISNEVEAGIKNADGVVSTGGIALSATDHSSIHTVSVAASVAAAFSKDVGVGLSGAGAESTNKINTKTNALVENSVLTANGDVSITSDASSAAGSKTLTPVGDFTAGLDDAATTDMLEHDIFSSGTLVNAEGTPDPADVNADNTFKTTLRNQLALSPVDINLSTDPNDLAVTIRKVDTGADSTDPDDDTGVEWSVTDRKAGISVIISKDVSGNFTVFEPQISAVVIGASVAVGVGKEVGAGLAIGASVARNLIGSDQDESAGMNRPAIISKNHPGEVQARILNSSVNTMGGNLALTATAQQSIDAFVGAFAAAVGGSGGVGLAGAARERGRRTESP